MGRRPPARPPGDSSGGPARAAVRLWTFGPAPAVRFAPDRRQPPMGVATRSLTAPPEESPGGRSPRPETRTVAAHPAFQKERCGGEGEATGSVWARVKRPMEGTLDSGRQPSRASLPPWEGEGWGRGKA